MLSHERNTKSREPRTRVVPLKAGVIIFAGALAASDNGLAAPGRTAVGLVGLGRATETVDNSTGAAGAKRVPIEAGCFCYGNSPADAVTAASIGKQVFIVDDETVAATNGTNTRSVAGICFDVDDGGVWVTFA